MTHFAGKAVIVASALAALMGWSAAAGAAEIFTITSTTFKDGTLMPKRVANGNPQNPNCVGKNVSPQFSWKNPPAGTVSYALTMIDPEGRPPFGVFHWDAYGIPASVTSFAEGEASKLNDKYVGGKSLMGVGYYFGPCTPPGPAHHYTFVLMATDLDPKALPPGLTIPELQEKLKDHVKGDTGIVGLFRHP